MFFALSGIGTVAFDTRLGLYEDPPKQEALKFIEMVQAYFELTMKLALSIPSNMVRPYMDTPAMKKFLKAGDDILDIGQGFVDNKMRELKEIAEKGIDPSGPTQGIFTFLLDYEQPLFPLGDSRRKPTSEQVQKLPMSLKHDTSVEPLV